MAHKATFTDRIEVEDNKIVRIVNAAWKDKTLDVYKQYLDGECYVKHVNFSYCGGYTVEFPGEKRTGTARYYYGDYVEEDNFGKCQALNLWCSYHEPVEVEAIIKAEPRLKYFFKKIQSSNLTDTNLYMFNINYQELMSLMNMYLTHPECEELIRLGFYRLVLNNNFYKLTKPKLKTIINFIKEHVNEMNADTKLRDIQFAMRNKISVSYASYWLNNYFSRFVAKEVRDFLFKNQLDPRLYNDYIRMAKSVGHDVEEDYWKYPKNLNEFHERVMSEVKNIEAARNKDKAKAYTYAVQNMCKKYGAQKVCGYMIYIPDDITDIMYQAEQLHQCLMTCDYPTKVIKRQSILVFIKKGKKPVATAEITYNKKIQQFYANEADRRNCKPTDDVVKAFNKWLENFKPVRRAIRIKKQEGEIICQN